MAETCSVRGFSWLLRSCMPDPNPISPEPRRIAAADRPSLLSKQSRSCSLRCGTPPASPSICDLPDDLLVECLSRLPVSSLPAVSLVCRRFSDLLNSPAFLQRRRAHGLLRGSLVAVSLSDIGLLSSACHPNGGGDGSVPWEVLPYPIPIPSGVRDGYACASFSHARLSAIGRFVYILGRGASARYDTWTESIAPCSPTIFPRKKFAAAAIGGRIYAAGGAARTTAVEAYHPETDSWQVVAEAPRQRYGCVGAAAGDVFYIIGGLKIGGRGDDDLAPTTARADAAHVYASTMDAFDVGTGSWLRTKAVPGGACVVGACSAGGKLYVLASHAVEVSFWRWEAAKGRRGRGGEWARLKAPPVPGQVRVGGALRFACVGVGESSVAVVVVHSAGSSGHGVRDGWVKEGTVLLYDARADEWNRGVDVPAAFRRAACVSVEC